VDYELKDSGNRQEFETGSRRDTQDGKTRPDLIAPEFIRALGDLLAKGAVKYGERNWEKGQPLGRVMASIQRHLLQVVEGDTSEDHLSAVAFGIMVIQHHLPRIADGRLPASLADAEWTDAWLEPHLDKFDLPNFGEFAVGLAEFLNADWDALFKKINREAAINTLLCSEEVVNGAVENGNITFDVGGQKVTVPFTSFTNSLYSRGYSHECDCDGCQRITAELKKLLAAD
jgi:hypothetical protein